MVMAYVGMAYIVVERSYGDLILAAEVERPSLVLLLARLDAAEAFVVLAIFVIVQRLETFLYKCPYRCQYTSR